MKEYSANRKLLPVINFMVKIIGVSELVGFYHRSEGRLTDIFLLNGDTVKSRLVEKVKQANSFGIMTDKVTDISVFSHLVTFIQYWDYETQLKFSSFPVYMT